MKKMYMIILFVAIANAALGFNIRNKRQTEDGEDSLEDRYGWFRPSWTFPTQRPQWTAETPNFRFPNQWSPNQYPDPGFNPGQALFPNQQFPNQNSNQGIIPIQGQLPKLDQTSKQGLLTTTQNPINGSSTTLSPQNNPTVQACISSCPVTSEYNPVCGSNLVTYPNPGRLRCAQACGISVNMLRSSPCPTTTAAPA